MTNLVAPLLLEIGCEELPAGPLPRMAEAFAAGLESCLSQAGLLADDYQRQIFFTPRRIAVHFTAVAAQQAEQHIEKRGPAVNVAFDSEGRPTPAALGFARSVKADIADLQRFKTDQGEWLFYILQQPGEALASVLQMQLGDILNKLPMPKTMRWGAGSQRFLRPVHWLVAMHGSSVLPLSVFDLQAADRTRGHRVQAAGEVLLRDADDYQEQLKNASVIADFSSRQQRIIDQVQDLAKQAGRYAPTQPELCAEVANLVEWPVAVLCSFDESFLDVPAEALTLSMKIHQKFFPLYSDAEHTRLDHHFIAVANLDSTDPAQVKAGFERVIRPRLADAKFFWDQDRKHLLAAFAERLESVAFQQDLGTLADKTRRTQLLAAKIADHLDIDPTLVVQAADLSLCDLMTDMVGEFPELQGIMGRYYALESNEDPAVAAAIEEHYQPIGSGQPIAASRTGQILAIAERTDRLLGIFAAGKKPTGNKDPFALRRAALGLIRTLIEGRLELPLDWLVAHSAEVLASQIQVSEATKADVIQFIYDRLSGYLPVDIQVYRSVSAKAITNLVDFSARAAAVQAFSERPEAASLAAANKRASNLLRQNPLPEGVTINADILDISEEKQLFDEISSISGTVEKAMQQRDYPAALATLATLQQPVDRFLEDVMVMVDQQDIRNNRLALLAELQSLCCQVADIAELDV